MKLTQKQWEAAQLSLFSFALRVVCLLALVNEFFWTHPPDQPNSVVIPAALGGLGLPSVVKIANKLGNGDAK